MKRNLILAVLAVVILASSCGGGNTVVTGNYGDKPAPDSVKVIMSDNGSNLSFPVANGVFTAKIPTSKAHSAIIEGVYLIPDGNKMDIDFTGNTPVLDPKDSEINRRVIEFLDAQRDILRVRDDFMVEYQAKIDRGEIVESSFYDDYDRIEQSLIDLCRKAINENTDNDLALQALKMIHLDLKDTEVQEILDKLSPELKESNLVAVLSSALSSRALTAEGQMFTDFTINYTDGSPSVKLSDYVGRGKYILVDFWASWCGPCRAEVPYLMDVYKKYKGDKFDILGLAVWDKITNSQEAIKEMNLPWPFILGCGDVAPDTYGVNAIPHIILFGPDGTILHRDLRGEDIEKAILEEFAK